MLKECCPEGEPPHDRLVGLSPFDCRRGRLVAALGRCLARRARLSSGGPRSAGRGFSWSWSTNRPLAQMKTYVATPENRERDWLVFDAEGATLGRLATQGAGALRGKRKPEYTPHCDTGDFVVVVNAAKVRVTGNKLADKRYYRHSGYPGGFRSRTLAEMLERRPEEVIRKAVKGMLTRNRLGRQQLRKLKVYAGPEHPHRAQQPKPVPLESR